MEYKPLTFKFARVYLAIAIILFSIDIYNLLIINDIGDMYNSYRSTFSVIFFLMLIILFSITYITSRFKAKGGVFSTTRIFLIPLIVVYRELGLWSYIILLLLSHLIVERENKPFIIYSCAKSYISGFTFSHLLLFLSQDQPFSFNNSFLVPYFSTSLASYLIDIVDHYFYFRVRLIDRSKIWHNIIEVERAVIPNYLLSVFLAAIIILLYSSSDIRYLALVLPIIIFAVAVYRRFYAIFVEDRAAKIEEESHVSHELSILLNSVISFSNTLLKGKDVELSEEQKKNLGILRDSSGHLLEIMSELSDLPEIEIGDGEGGRTKPE